MQAMIVFSHLRCDFVFQRPQHLMTRLARHYRVLFVEEPDYREGASRLEIHDPAPNLQVLRPRTCVKAGGFHDDQLPELRHLLAGVIERERPEIAWLYTPMALPLLPLLEPRVIVYDCMDELAAFRSAPRQLLQREAALLKVANLVFAGGPSLHRSRQARHPAVHCFPSSVDAAHFARARDARIEHPDLLPFPRPRLGFYGVIDERLDAGLVHGIASARPDWQIMLVGPLAKISRAALPRNANIHYLGGQSYADLPRFLAGWDACLLPFALNAATRHISPTKTLEYMAAQRPVISTPIADVAEMYADVVRIAAGPQAFTQACAAALGESDGERRQRCARMEEIVSRTSWDATADAMRALIDQERDRGLNDAAREMLEPARAGAAQPHAAGVRARSCGTIVLGAGPTGLSAAYHLGADSLLLEQCDTVGGWCRSIEDRGFIFDYAGHIMFSSDPYVHELYRLLLGDNVHWQDREAWIHSKGVHTRYPFQGALHGLPPQVIKECLVGAIEARFGRLCNASSAPANDLCKSDSIGDCCGDGVAESTVPLAPMSGTDLVRGTPRNFEEFIYRVWGAGIARHFALPYNRKLWAVPLTEMETSWLGGRVPMPDLEQMIEGALEPVAKPMGANARFGYPLRGGFQALMNGFLPHLQGELRLNARVVRVSPVRHTVVLEDGTTFGYEHLVSTLPLPVLVRMAGDDPPEEVRQAAAGLRHVSVRCVNLGIGREHVTDKHWIYYPEDPVFHRVFAQGNASPCCNPPGGFGLTCEISYSASKPLPCDGPELISRCVEDCIRVGLIRADDRIIAANQLDMPYAYVVYDHSRARCVQRIRSWFEQHGVVLAGRYSEWEYYNSDHAFIAGKRAASQVKSLQRYEDVAGLRSA